MSLKTYTAYTMAEALAAVRQDLGAQAVILHTRFYRRGGFLGLGRESVVEVTAQSGPSRRSAGRQVPQPAASGDAPAKAAARMAYGSRPSSPRSPGFSLADPGLDEFVPEVNRAHRMAMLLSEQLERRMAKHAAPAPAMASVLRAPGPAGRGAPARRATTPAPAASPPPVARRFILTSPSEPLLFQEQPTALPAAASCSPVRTVPADGDNGRDEGRASAVTDRPPLDDRRSPQSMRQELAAIREMVAHVLQQQARPLIEPGQARPAALQAMYLQLIAQDVSEEMADRIITAVRSSLHHEELQQPSLVRSAVVRELASFVPVAAEPITHRACDGRALTIALVGPTGVGKTTTLAKLAASIKLGQQRRVGLVTADTYRIAAVEQLRTYADIIGLPLHVVQTPDEMSQAMQALREQDVILIDTAGRSQHDGDKLRELRTMLAAAEPHEVHLVLSSTSGPKALLHEAQAFSSVGIHKIVLTKLDEAVSFGVLIEVTQKIGKQLSFLTTGQEVPDHLEPCRPQRLAELALGGAVRA